MKRRNIIRSLAGAAFVPCLASTAFAAGAPLSILVAGPDGDEISRWGNACGVAMAANFPGAPGLVTQPDGGLDGVTGANRLDSMVVPDGQTAAIMPGAALIAWLTGDPRVHYDPTRWAPVLAGCGSGVLVVRKSDDTAPSPASLRAMAPLRLAASAPQSNDLAALLALERMGVKTAPVFGLHDADAKVKAFLAGNADAVFFSGEGVPEDMAPLAESSVAVFSIGMLGADGVVSADPLFPNLPDAIDFSDVPASPLDAAYLAAAAAARLDFIMVLPKLTAADAVAQWRAAGAAAINAPAMQAAASASAISLTASPVAAAALMTLRAAQSHQAGLQVFLVQRFGWQPS
jgi:hypothetical protein